MKIVGLLLLSLLTLACCCEYFNANDETRCHSMEFDKNQLVNLTKYGNKFDFLLIRGGIYASNFQFLPEIKEITIRSSNISYIDPDFFHLFPNLDSLTIKLNHGFPNLTTTMFTNCCQQLTVLRIYDNNFKYLDNAIFRQFPNLQFLWIEKQYLGPLTNNYFDGLMNLKKLRLQHCQIKEIQRNAFDNLINLNKLEIPVNQVEYIQPGTFKNLKNLEELKLSGNSINNFTGGEFDGLTNLKKLELYGNKINSLNVEKILENLPNLQHIAIKLTLFECNKAKKLVDKIQESNIEIKNIDEVLSDSCQDL